MQGHVEMTMSGKINDGDTAPTVELSTTMHTLLKNEFFEDITEFFEVYTAAKQHELGVPSAIVETATAARNADVKHSWLTSTIKHNILRLPCWVGRSGRSVADSLFRPHPEQRARASREPKFFDISIQAL